MEALPMIHKAAATAHAWSTGYGDAEAGLDNGERLYGHDSALLAAYRRGQERQRDSAERRSR